MSFRSIGELADDVMAGVEQRDSVVRSDAGPRQRVKFEEVAGGVEAPADARKVAEARHASSAKLREVVILPSGGVLAGRSIATAPRRTNGAKSPSHAAPAVVIDLLVEKERRRHVVTAMTIDSFTTRAPR